MAEDSNKWEGIVNQNRNAEQVKFPLQDQSLSVIRSDRKFKPRMKTELEQDLYGLMNRAEISTPKGVNEMPS